MKKRKYTLSDEARAAVSERMRKMQAARKLAKSLIPDGPTNVQTIEPPQPPQPVHVVAPEVQAVLDTMDPSRRAKLAMIQARTMSTGFVSERERVEAMQRATGQHTTQVLTDEQMPGNNHGVLPPLPPTRIGSREVSIILRTDGTMVSQWGPCICGRPKRDWHKICVKVEENHNG